MKISLVWNKYIKIKVYTYYSLFTANEQNDLDQKPTANINKDSMVQYLVAVIQFSMRRE